MGVFYISLWWKFCSGSLRLTNCLVENITNGSGVRRNWESVLHTFAFFSLVKSQAGFFACLKYENGENDVMWLRNFIRSSARHWNDISKLYLLSTLDIWFWFVSSSPGPDIKGISFLGTFSVIVLLGGCRLPWKNNWLGNLVCKDWRYPELKCLNIYCCWMDPFCGARPAKIVNLVYFLFFNFLRNETIATFTISVYEF